MILPCKSMFRSLAAAAVGICLPITAFASDVNSHEVKNGDIVTYEIHAISCPTLIQAIDCSVYYDVGSLEYIDGTLAMPALESPVYNTDISGEIRLNAITVEGFDFSEDSVIAIAQFRVKDDSAEKISLYYNMKNFYDENDTEWKNEYTYDMTSAESEAEARIVMDAGDAGIDNNIIITESDIISSDIKNENSEDTELSTDTNYPISSATDREMIYIDEQSDIPSEMAITFETLDTAQPFAETRRKHIIVMAMSAAIMVLIAVVIVTLTKSSDDDSKHTKK